MELEPERIKKTTFGNLSRDEVLVRRDAVKADLDTFLRMSNADLAPLLQEALQPALTAHQELKARSGRIDFLDLLIKARDLVRDNCAVREELQKRFTHYFVDEFQDTDPIQAEVLLLLAADDPSETNWLNVSPISGKLSFVGDPKQSIYRFRRADVVIYQQVKQMLLSRGAVPLYLNTSFRSPPSLQSFVNAAFAPAMAGTVADGEYVPLENWRPEITGRPTIIALPVPRPYNDRGNIVNSSIDASLPEATGAFIDWLVNESGWTVEEDKKVVRIAPRHICILFRRFKNFSADVTRPYVRALEARRVSRASCPTIKVQTVTTIAAGADLTEPALARIELEKVARVDAERPSGRRFGALVHAVLATVDFDANADEIEAIAEANARLMDATPEETYAAVTTACNVLEHPLIKRAATAQALRRETPLQHYRDDGTLIEGVVDLAFQENTPEFHGWTVVDFQNRPRNRESRKSIPCSGGGVCRSCPYCY
jgi:ATP-dependent exoDNAse (exonuclease V) beta subunit